MWDEKKFFEDFKNQSKKIQPNKEFVDRTVDLVSGNSNVVTFRKRKTAYTAVAAVLVMAIGIGGVWATNTFKGSDRTQKVAVETTAYDNESHAGKADAETGSSGVVEADGTAEVIKLLEDKDVIVTDKQGNPLSQEQRHNLVLTVSAAKVLDEEQSRKVLTKESKTEEYKLIGNYLINIKIIDGKYIIIHK